MCQRCVRFVQAVTGTNEPLISGRGSNCQIDVFPGVALDNELSANVIDLCPVGALLDKDFLFQQRVWFLANPTPTERTTCSRYHSPHEHNDGRETPCKPRTHHGANRWWITDEVR